MMQVSMFFHRLLTSFVKAGVLCIVVGIGLIVALRLGPIVLTYCIGYSDNGLYSSAKECVVNTVGVDKINAEARKVFCDSCWEGPTRSSSYEPPRGSCLDNVSHTLPGTIGWNRKVFDGHRALVLRFGWHYNYAWLIIVNPDVHASCDGSTIRCVVDNIVVSNNSGRIQGIY